jgi:alpha-beta hydrolase superfamily lysophospholipase
LKKAAARGSPCTMAEEVEHVLAIAKKVKPPIVLFGHSSGGTVAVETLVASPSTFIGGIIYEPALVLPGPLGVHLAGDVLGVDGKFSDGVTRSRAALAAGMPGKALGIFIGIAAAWPPWASALAGTVTAWFPKYRELIPCQIDDLEVMERLGLRLDAYRRLQVPMALIGASGAPRPSKQWQRGWPKRCHRLNAWSSTGRDTVAKAEIQSRSPA